ncbi:MULTISPECIES: GNAT family N-acetyltransferase [Paenibacillus]|uniref:GNAT family N-acetyltransferase n=1 Tax=Paenibacillus TaxID=44249 RepID=UPI00038F7DFE|nr:MULTISPECIES: GNAT family N-acetyltransferase [Paenibacillus]ASS67116.1 GNAT family N-acetyltransferase [Paenibacillus sp. RUD330]KKC47934.1 GCN5 family acetyltransferase [Paenibacillus sp. D9]SIQ89753.1 Acetyltransferase (GNAT) domain-containing protein [Paenibacillus sp. RU4X]SIR10567.1 Acetyltransferase (GNAT) domain-containing protein [Paenibacillus sp. RU4T]
MHLRSFQLADYHAVTSLLQSVLSEECYELTIEALTRQLSWDSDLVLIASAGDKMTGIIIGTIDNNRGYYYRVAVHPDHRGQGIAKSLISSLRGRFEQRKVSKIMVTADEHNEPVLPLYSSLGFEPSDFYHSFQKLSIVAG